MGERNESPSGVLVVDKPQGVTSHDVVAAVRGALHTRKVGHAGTLDPMATGVLVIGFGNATRLLNTIVEHDKTYEATIRLGQSTTTDDADGDLLPAVPSVLRSRWRELSGGCQTEGGSSVADVSSVSRSRWRPSRETNGGAVCRRGLGDSRVDMMPADRPSVIAGRWLTQFDEGGSPSAAVPSVSRSRWRELSGGCQTEGGSPSPLRESIERAIAEHFTGPIEQVPNTFSAIKVNGQRAYDLAREGKTVELKARPVTIHEFTVLNMRIGYADGERAGLPLVMPGDAADADTGVVSPLQPVIDLDVRVSCSSGTYIRALARDLGAELGVGGHLTRLRRTRVGRFALDGEAASPAASRAVGAHVETRTFTNREGEQVTRNRAVLDLTGDDLLARAMTMAEAASAAMPVVAISERDAAELRFGRRIPYDIRGVAAAIVPSTGDVAAIITRAKRGEAKPVTVFPPTAA